MRWEIILALALCLPAAAGAQADEWCGYASRDKSIIECGYSSITDCENAVGKGGVCFVDPDYALAVSHAAPAPNITPAIAAKPDSGRG
jgi:hypothetical protein